MHQFPVVKLGAICAFKYGEMPGKGDYVDEGYPIFSGYRVVGFARRFHYKTPEIVVVARGVGGTGDIKLTPPHCFLTNLAIAILPTSEIVDKSFLYWRLRATTLWSLRTGSAQAQITINRLKDYEVELPPLPTQRKVAAILSAYDDLIDNNRRRIELLEEMARRNYREWFVDFRYPGHDVVPLVDSEIGPLPERWHWRPLEELVQEVRQSVDPQSIPASTPYFGLEHLPEHSLALDRWGTADQVTSLKFRFQVGDVLFGKIRPYFHKVGPPPVAGICSTDAIVLRACASRDAMLGLAVVSSDAFVAHAVQTSQGTKMPRANWSVLRSYPVPYPDGQSLAVFGDQLDALVAQIHCLVMTNRALAEARDVLLPRLMSGEIDVEDLDIPAAEAAA